MTSSTDYLLPGQRVFDRASDAAADRSGVVIDLIERRSLALPLRNVYVVAFDDGESDSRLRSELQRTGPTPLGIVPSDVGAFLLTEAIALKDAEEIRASLLSAIEDERAERFKWTFERHPHEPFAWNINLQIWTEDSVGLFRQICGELGFPLALEDDENRMLLWDGDPPARVHALIRQVTVVYRTWRPWRDPIALE